MPLVSAVRATRQSGQGPIAVVDVGAAVGDTALLLMDACREDIATLLCVEGDEEFLRYLSNNVGSLPEVAVHPAVVSDIEGEIPCLVRTHLGTAGAQGETTTHAVTLDSVLGDYHVDVLKIDTDGWDGRILSGAVTALRRDVPVVVFEWAPCQLEATGNRWQVPFEVLRNCGYTAFVWFDKFGRFSHVDSGDPGQVEPVEQMCIRGEGPAPDWHFDVIALHPARPVGLATLARTRFQHRSG
jgi:FkbM family methyltransferase